MHYLLGEALKACVWFSMSLFPLPLDKDLGFRVKIIWSRAMAALDTHAP